ncbi:MAG: MbnH family di-heme enzyme [Gemmatimonadota bacterium]|nr:MbnH family di-heme enzyme [Gemmatimonadota bacterium]
MNPPRPRGSASLGAAVLLVGLTVLAAGAPTPPAQDAWQWGLPEGVPPPRIPVDNPMSPARVELGRHLFYDRRLSGNRRLSCAGCHEQSMAFADVLPRAVGSTAEVHPRGSMSLTNVAYLPVLTWANPTLRRLEQQALVPMFGEDPVELGLAGRGAELLARLRAVTRYQELFASAFPGASEPLTIDNVTRALAVFQRSLVSFDAPYDRYRNGDVEAMSPSALRGEALFNGDRFRCARCHVPPFFTSTTDHEGREVPDIRFFNNGLYNIGGDGRYPPSNAGIATHTRRASDRGLFRAPTLRNLSVTRPYMHDGSVDTLEDVLDHYAAGGRTIDSGPYRGVGREHPNKSDLVSGFEATLEERADLIEFLRALTDSTFLNDPSLSDPWLRSPGRE